MLSPERFNLALLALIARVAVPS